jgi:K+/H+ antiporter YhaU regulatory subunit KhtT
LRVPALPAVDLAEISEALGSAATETFVVPMDSPAAGKTIGQLKLRTNTGVSVIAIIHDGNTDINPGPDAKIGPDDVMVLLGTPEKIDRAVEKYFAAPGA